VKTKKVTSALGKSLIGLDSKVNPALLEEHYVLPSTKDYVFMSGLNRSGILVGICFTYSLVDVLLLEADSCLMPMQRWLLVSYISIGVFMGMQTLGKRHSHAEQNFLFSFRQKSKVAQLIVITTWCLLLPFFTVWTILGTHWLREMLNTSVHCASEGAHPQLIFFWQLLSYVWIFIHLVYLGIATVMEYRMRRDERNMRLIESEDSLQRWGRLELEHGPVDRNTMRNADQGLQPSKILALPCDEFEEDTEAGCQLGCPICLSDFAEGENIRTLPGCGHSFHKSCIDLWLLRRADCPMCKAIVS